MLNLLVLKERLRSTYQKYEVYIKPSVKFILALVVFMLINMNLGYNEKLSSLPVVIIMSLIAAFTPVAVLVLLAAVVSIGHIYSASMILAGMAVIVLLILYLMFLRFTPKLGYVVLAIPILYLLNIPYLIPILLGLIATPISIIPVSCGVIIYYLFHSIQVMGIQEGVTSVEDIVTTYKSVFDGLFFNKVFILTLCTFAVVILVTYFVRKLSIDHAFDIAIVVGGAVNIVIFLIGDIIFNASHSIFSMIVGTVISCAIVYVIQFFRLALEYTGVEFVQFEDDDYYYYVKAVPKIKVTTPEVNVKRYSNPVQATKEPKEVEQEEIDDIKVDTDFLDEDDTFFHE